LLIIERAETSLPRCVNYSSLWLEQAVAIEENPYLYKSKPGKERDLMIPMGILQLEAIETILKSNNILTEEKKKQVDSVREQLNRLSQGLTLGALRIET
jgi:hypothetical protein